MVTALYSYGLDGNMLLRFKSDDSEAGKGFTASYKSAAPGGTPPTPVPGPGKKGDATNVRLIGRWTEGANPRADWGGIGFSTQVGGIIVLVSAHASAI